MAEMTRTQKAKLAKDIATGDTRSALQQLVAQLEATQGEARKKTAQEEARAKMLAQLDAIGGTVVTDDGIKYEGTKIILPAQMEGSLGSVIGFLEQVQEAEEELYEMSREFPYKPWDGAAAFNRAMTRVFGTSGVGKTQRMMFFSQPPQLISVPISHSEQVQVPWGAVQLSMLDDAMFVLGGTRSAAHGIVFNLEVTAKKKHRRRIEGFFSVVEDELKARSIYRGKAIDGADEPGFWNPWLTDPARVIYSSEVERQLDANVWTIIDHAERMRELGMPLKRAVLLEGPYGSGKTLAGHLTAQKAVADGFTFIMVRAGIDDPFRALKTARMYAPAVVLIEDLDVLSVGKSREELQKLLDQLDNVQAKGAEVMVLFTSNFPEKIDKAVLRPGRIDSVIHIEKLDDGGAQRIIEATVGTLLATGINWAEVTPAYRDFLPAYATEAAQRAIRYMLARTGGKEVPITGTDLVAAAEGLKPQLELANEAAEAKHQVPTLERLFTQQVEGVLKRATVDGEPIELMTPQEAAANGNR